MKVLALLSQKGGAGKSTLARSFAVAALLDEIRVVVIDADPQGTVVNWRQRRDAEAPTVVALDGKTLAERIDEVRAAGADLCIIDTPPHLRAIVGMAAEAADAAIIPCRPTPEDLEAIGPTLQILQGTNTRTGLVFNAVPSGARVLALARAGVAALGLPVCPTAITERVAHPYASSEGMTVQEREPTSRGAAEITEVWRWASALLQ